MERLGREVRASLQRLSEQSKKDGQHTVTFKTRESTTRDEATGEEEQLPIEEELTSGSKQESSNKDYEEQGNSFAALRKRIQHRRLQETSQRQRSCTRTETTQGVEDWDAKEPEVFLGTYFVPHVYITGLPQDVTNKQIKLVFSKSGQIKTIGGTEQVYVYPMSLNGFKCASVEYTSTKEATQAICDFNNKALFIFQHHPIKVDY
ncbi:unnamed protein product, partial [Didymodactylos carnosus]